MSIHNSFTYTDTGHWKQKLPHGACAVSSPGLAIDQPHGRQELYWRQMVLHLICDVKIPLEQ